MGNSCHQAHRAFGAHVSLDSHQRYQNLRVQVRPSLCFVKCQEVQEHYNPIIKKIRAIEKPVVAAVNGVAAGAGASIALCCDIVVATESASFIQAFSKIGLIPDSSSTFFYQD